MELWKVVIFASKNSKCPKNNLELSVWLWIIPWAFIHSLKPWSYDMCSYCRDSKTQKWCRWLALRGWPFAGQDDNWDCFPNNSSKIWTRAICKSSLHVNCMSGSGDNFLKPKWWNLVNHPCNYMVPWTVDRYCKTEVTSLWRDASFIFKYMRLVVELGQSLNLKAKIWTTRTK
jgi:hypothetical protein